MLARFNKSVKAFGRDIANGDNPFAGISKTTPPSVPRQPPSPRVNTSVPERQNEVPHFVENFVPAVLSRPVMNEDVTAGVEAGQAPSPERKVSGRTPLTSTRQDNQDQELESPGTTEQLRQATFRRDRLRREALDPRTTDADSWGQFAQAIDRAAADQPTPTPRTRKRARSHDMASLVGTQINKDAQAKSPQEAKPKVVPADSVQGKTLEELTSAMLALARQIAEQSVQDRSPRLDRPEAKISAGLKATFSGLEHEDPVAFLDRLERWFRKNQINDDEDRMAYAGDQLRGAAGLWFRPQRAFPMKYSEFWAKLVRKYNDPDLMASLTASLYGHSQGQEEPVEIFLLKKKALHDRIMGTNRDDDFNRLAVTLLRPELRSRVRGQVWEDSLVFMARVQQLEGDVLEERRALKAIAAPPYVPPFTGYTPKGPAKAIEQPKNNPDSSIRRVGGAQTGAPTQAYNFKHPDSSIRPVGDARNGAPTVAYNFNTRRNDGGYRRGGYPDGNPRSGINWRKPENIDRQNTHDTRDPPKPNKVQKFPRCRYCEQYHEAGQCRAIEAAPVKDASIDTRSKAPGNCPEAAL